MSGTESEIDNERRANELYWSSDLSVNQLAERLDLSKSTLYGLIRPLPAGLSCPVCSEEVVYPNRTAKDRGMVACAACGWEGDEEDSSGIGGDGSVTLPVTEDDLVDSPPARLDAARSRTLVGGALLGAAAGLALVFWARRR